MIPEARDTAQQVVTLFLNDQRHEAVDLVDEFPCQMLLSIALADMVAYVHDRWSKACDMDLEQRAGAWQSLMADIAEWRLTKETQT